MKQALMAATLILCLVFCRTGFATRDGGGGFFVFSNGTVYYYAAAADKTLVLKASAPAAESNRRYAVCGQRLFCVDALLGTIAKLDVNLKEQKRITLKAEGDITRLLGSDEKRLFLLAGNRVTVLDENLDTVALIDLKPEGQGGIVPVVSPVDFDIHGGRQYLLSEAGAIFILEANGFQDRVSVPPMDGDTHMTLRAQWVDPEGCSLNVLAETRTETYDPSLGPGERKISSRLVVFSFRTKEMHSTPDTTVIYEKKELCQRPSLKEGAGKEGIISERMSPCRPEGEATGVYVSALSKGMPCIASVFFQEKGIFPFQSDFVLLKSRGQVEKLAVFRDDKTGVLWFRQNEKIRFILSDPSARVLHIYPHALLPLLSEPVMKARDVQVLAY